ncbi:MAG: hypothetical protein RL324_705 [Verrucomicrobiota bacterium]|jgi:hypothetical protein
MSTTHKEFHFSVTIHTDDKFLLGCLRALSQEAQSEINVRIPWGGTKASDWIRRNHRATFRFTSAAKRELFLREAQRLLPQELWKVTGTNDDDPASPQDSR